jgi:hypothetical protein
MTIHREGVAYSPTLGSGGLLFSEVEDNPPSSNVLHSQLNPTQDQPMECRSNAPDTISAMNPVALYFASGESLYLGATLLILAIGASPFLKHARSFRVRNVGAWVGLAIAVMGCPPFPVVIDLILLAAFVLWFIASNHDGVTQTWMRLQRGSTVVLMGLLLLLTAIEFSHREMPAITGKPSDHLVIIGDSISSGGAVRGIWESS